MPTLHLAAFERMPAALDALGLNYRVFGSQVNAQCPSHDDKWPSLTIYAKPGRVRIRCWAGYDDTAVLAALRLTVADLYDEPRASRNTFPPSRSSLSRPKPRTRVEAAVDRLLARDDLGQRIADSIAMHSRPELYILARLELEEPDQEEEGA